MEKKREEGRKKCRWHGGKKVVQCKEGKKVLLCSVRTEERNCGDWRKCRGGRKMRREGK